MYGFNPHDLLNFDYLVQVCIKVILHEQVQLLNYAINQRSKSNILHNHKHSIFKR
jgi:hypothetical protein